jgi:CARDB
LVFITAMPTHDDPIEARAELRFERVRPPPHVSDHIWKKRGKARHQQQGIIQKTMRRKTATVILFLSLLLVAGCGSGGGSGGGSPPPMPAYINGTATGQFGPGDLGFYLGAKTTPATPTASTPDPKLNFDIGNGWSHDVTNVSWRVLKNGTLFTSGTATSIPAFGWVDVAVSITPGSGSSIYRIEIDYNNNFSETNENNNWVEYAVSIAFSG